MPKKANHHIDVFCGASRFHIHYKY